MAKFRLQDKILFLIDKYFTQTLINTVTEKKSFLRQPLSQTYMCADSEV